MKIVAVDPQARVLSEEEILRLGMVDGKSWPVVMPVGAFSYRAIA